ERTSTTSRCTSCNAATIASAVSLPKKIISAYLHWLNEALKEANCHLHAFVLMTNHVHLVLAPAHALDVPRLIISLGRRYVQYVNRSYRRTGTLGTAVISHPLS